MYMYICIYIYIYIYIYICVCFLLVCFTDRTEQFTSVTSEARLEKDGFTAIHEIAEVMLKHNWFACTQCTSTVRVRVYGF